MYGRVDGAVRAVGRRVVATWPGTWRPLRYLRSLYALLYLRATALRVSAGHPAPIDPFRVDRVDPDAVTRVCERFVDLPKYRNAGRVVGGDWDRDTERFEDRTLYRSFRAHFEEGVPWTETAFFGSVLARIEDGREQWGCRDRAALERRCRRLDDLYASVAVDGVRSQAELAAADAGVDIGKPRASGWDRRLEDEIAVHVGRDGEFLFADGRNRLAIAKLLGVESVPVRVLVRHERWQAFRDAVAVGDAEPGAHADHPDVRDLATRADDLR